MSFREIRQQFEVPPAFSITIEGGEIVISWGNSFLKKHTNDLLDHLVVIEEDNLYACFPTTENPEILEILERHGWETISDLGTTCLKEDVTLASDQLVSEIVSLEQDL